MLYLPLGDTHEIGASCHYLKIGNTGIILDAGQHPNDDGPDGLPRIHQLERRADLPVDHVVVTHGHHDHIGALPILLRHFPHAMAHMTRATRSVADFVLPASARLQHRRWREGSARHEPMFAEDELEGYSYLYLVHELNENFNVTGYHGNGRIHGRFFHAGHVLGSAGVLLEFSENGRDRRAFYTGDTSMRSQLIMPGADYPEEDIDVLLMEGTLGADADAEFTTRREEERRFFEAIRATLERGGSVLVPVFALGRSQETLAMLDHFRRHQGLGSEVPVYTTGGMRAIAGIYDQTRFITPRLNKDFEVFGVPQKRFPRRSDAALEVLRKPGIHLAGSGMMFANTLSNKIAQKFIGDERNAVLLVGFAKEDSPAYQLLEARLKGKGEKVILDPAKSPQEVHCPVERFRFSGHAHRRDLLHLVDRLRPSKVVLVHAEPDAREWLADNIRYFHPEIEIVYPETGVPQEI